MMKKVFCIVLISILFLFPPGVKAQQKEKYSITYFSLFDTVTTLSAYASSQKEFDVFAKNMIDRLNRLHQVFDGYHPCENIHNLYYINHADRSTEIPCEKELFTLLKWVKDIQPLAQNKVNVALGGVLQIWHDAREENVSLPDMSLLQKAACHADMEKVILNEERRTVYFSDPYITLDLGGVAKGYAVEEAVSSVPRGNITSFILNVGGNIKCVGTPEDGRKAWNIGVADPFHPDQTAVILHISDTSAVTSGDYQRFYEVDGVRYHHLIDPATLMPAQYFKSVTVVTPDSGLADFLSTALFLMPYEEGLKLLETTDSAECLWILPDGQQLMTKDMEKLIR